MERSAFQTALGWQTLLKANEYHQTLPLGCTIDIHSLTATEPLTKYVWRLKKPNVSPIIPITTCIRRMTDTSAEYCQVNPLKPTRAANIPRPSVLFIVAAPYNYRMKDTINPEQKVVGFCFKQLPSYLWKSHRWVDLLLLGSKEKRGDQLAGIGAQRSDYKGEVEHCSGERTQDTQSMNLAPPLNSWDFIHLG